MPGTLLQRYKRFLADVRLDTGDIVTASCPNTGAMLGLCDPGIRVWLSQSDSPTRKYRHTWEISEPIINGRAVKVGINTGHPNRLVHDAIEQGRIPELAGYDTLKREVKYGVSSRIDILLSGPARGLCYVEVKNVHLLRAPGLAEFPDCRTERGVKHLRELSQMVSAGHRAVMVYLIQRADISRFRLAGDIDPAYVDAFIAAEQSGVEALAYCCQVSETAISVQGRVPMAAAEQNHALVSAPSGRTRRATVG